MYYQVENMISLVLLLLNSVWFTVSTPLWGLSEESKTLSQQRCLYGNVWYPAGHFRPDPENPCVSCDCHGDTGDLYCTYETCPLPDPECIRYNALPGECCPVCVEWGCYFGGVGYPRGALMPAGPCRRCHCPWDARGPSQGLYVCYDVVCPVMTCQDIRVPDGRCCPVCEDEEETFDKWVSVLGSLSLNLSK